MSDHGADPRVDELRERLRRLGYLDAGVNRFVLGPARGTRRPAVIALLASVRIGIMAALLLGPASAIGLGGRMPGLVTGARDAAVIALYVGILLGVAVAIAAFIASLAVASMAGDRVARRARALSASGGAFVSLVCLIYLTLWWRTAGAGLGGSAPVWTGFALAVAVSISLLLGHAVTVAAFAVMVARHAGTDTAPAAGPERSWKISILAGVCAFAGAGTLLVLTAPRGEPSEPAPRLTVISSGLRVRLIAIDGFDPDVFGDLARSGRVPALAAALGSARAQLAAENIQDPARAWTTIATGRTPDAHGVEGLETRRVAGLRGAVPTGPSSRLGDTMRAATDLLRLTRPAIASGNERREKTLWEVASDAGLRSAVINWWATWPVPADADTSARPGGPGAASGNIIFSDRAALRLDRGGALDAEIAPAALYEWLQPRWAGIRREAAARAARALSPLSTSDPDVRAVLLRSADLDATQLVLALQVPAPAADLLAVYLPGLDIAQHALLGAQDGALAASAVAIRVDALREYYVCLDRLLSEMLTPGADEVVVVVTQPGRVNAATGLMAITGRASRPGASLTGSATDVTPTVLYALGVPISRQLAGAPLTGLFPAEFTARYPVRQTATYGRRSMKTAARTGQPLDQEMIDRLRSLGYVR